ncbi:hypothetical protein L6164_022432 [Bauhinia variegata]|uniref:Uncharacterized protein n=1 Tax=Bauhinia variegata TaxID=167791 RepID=A0ACB9MF70_BAUVA|nr:hypothetical protein L6164_022432 [Bauhinia variegata]
MDSTIESIAMCILNERTYFGLNVIVEVCGREEGFLDKGSYYEAEIVFPIKYHNRYIVTYRNLLKEDQSGPLTAMVRPEDLRPLQPTIPVPATGFDFYDRVDAFDNGGWWVGMVTVKDGSNYRVCFEHNNTENTYPISQLRVHKEFINGQWV